MFQKGFPGVCNQYDQGK